MPNVYIIGDSISMGYTPVVTELLKGRANVDRNPGNSQYTSYGLRHLKEWLGNAKYDLIHFNWGIWDLHHLQAGADPLQPCTDRFDPHGVRRTTPEQYAANLQAIIDILKPTGAQLIWATITPLPGSEKTCVHGGEEVLYNTVSKKLMTSNGIAVNDLHARALPELARILSPDDCHFNDAGNRFLGEKVASVISSALNL